jgi:hypothetical protein
MEKMIADQSEVIATQKTENEALKSELLNFSKIVSESLAEIGDQPQDTKEVEHNFRNENKGKESIEEFRKRVFNA